MKASGVSMDATGRGIIMFNNEDNFCVIQQDYASIEDGSEPDPNEWQAKDLALFELDVAAGVCWHTDNTACPHQS